MSDKEGAEVAKASPTLLFFLVAGPILMVAGLIGAGAASANAQQQASVDAFSNVFAGGSPYATIPTDYTATWVWVAVGIVGLVLLITGLAIRAAKN